MTIDYSNISSILFALIMFAIIFSVLKSVFWKKYYKVRYKVRKPYEYFVISLIRTMYYLVLDLAIFASAKLGFIYFKYFWFSIIFINILLNFIGLLFLISGYCTPSIRDMAHTAIIERLKQQKRDTNYKKEKLSYPAFFKVILLISWLKTCIIVEINMSLKIENYISIVLGVVYFLSIYHMIKGRYAD